MRFDRTLAVAVLATGMMLGGAVGAANPEGEATPAPTEAKPSPQRRALSASPWRHADLKPEHAVLAAFAGHWTASVHLYEGPFSRERDTQATADGKSLMGGLFVQVTHSGRRMKQPFEGVMLYGFDRIIGKYTADWFDTTSTAVIHYIGTYDAAKKQLNMTSHYSDQELGRLTISRTVTTFVDANTWTYDEYMSRGVGQPETQIVSITFKRG